MKLKKLLDFTLALAMMLSAIGTVAFAEEADVWDGESYSIEWCKAEHTSAGSANGQTYYIETAADLAGLAYLINTWYDITGDNTWDAYRTNNAFQGDTVILNTDIDLADFDWAPIGWRVQESDKNAFRGNFDGNGHTIYNLNVPAEKYNYAGLFGKIATQNFTQTFKNITIENATVNSMKNTEKAGKEGAGALVGDSYGSTIINCHVKGDIDIMGYNYVGGLVGQSRSNISKSTVEATGSIESENTCAGGLVGYLIPHTNNGGVAAVSDCSVAGENGLAIKSDDECAGGLIGYVSSTNSDTLVINEVSVSNITVAAENSESGDSVALVAQNFNATNTLVANVTAFVAGEETIPSDNEIVSFPVAKVGDTYYRSLHDAVVNAPSGAVIDLIADDTYDVWNSVYPNSNLTINGNDHTIVVTTKIDSSINGGGMFLKAANLSINDLTVDLPQQPTSEMERLATMYSGTLNNVTVTGGTHVVSILGGDGAVVINNCDFENIAGWAIETEGKGNTALTVSNSKFDENAIIIRGEDNIFTDNTITGAGEGVNVLGDAIIEGNDFGESTLGIDSGVEVSITENKINSVEFTTWLAPSADAADYSKVEVSTNKLSDEAVASFNEKLEDEVVSVEPVAEIDGGKSFFSLSKAVAALTEGDTLKIASGRYDAFDILVDDVTITGMDENTEITINSIPANAFIGINANNVTVQGLKFVIPEDCEQKADYLAWCDAVIGYWSKNFDSGSDVESGVHVIDCDFVNNGETIGYAIFNFSSFEVSGCFFENFKVGISTMSDGSAMGTVVIRDNTFTKVNEPVNVYWGKTGDDKDSIAITGNTFVSALDADEVIKVTVFDYAAQNEGQSGISAADFSGNTFGAATEVTFVDGATDVVAGIEEDLANTENVELSKKYASVARIGGDRYYQSFEAAITDAKDGDVIDLLGNTITPAGGKQIEIKEDVTIQNGVIDITNTTWTADSVFKVSGGMVENFVTLTLKNVDVIGDNYSSAFGVIYATEYGKAVIDGCNFDLSNEQFADGGVLKGNGIAQSAFDVINSTFDLENPNRIITNATVNLDTVTIDAKVTDETLIVGTTNNHALRNVVGTIQNSTITIDGFETGLKNTANIPLSVTDSSLIVKNTKNEEGNDIYLDKMENLVKDHSIIDAKIYADDTKAVYYTLTFQTNGGEKFESVIVEENGVVDLSEYISKKEGYRFGGWYSDKALTQKITEITLDTNKTVYAKWNEKKPASVTGLPGGGGGGLGTNKTDDTEKPADTEDPADTETTGFTDLDAEAWYYDVVNTAIAKGLMNGVSATEFAPNTNLTRGMFVTILHRADGKTVVEGESTFSDVLEGQYYTDAVIWAAANGIVTGMAEEVFAPDENVTREQMATMISRYLAYKEIEISKEGEVVYTDDAQIADWAMDAVAEMKRAGLLEGNADGSFAPKRNATRAEAAALFVRLLNIL